MNISITGTPLLWAVVVVIAIIGVLILFMRKIYARRSKMGLADQYEDSTRKGAVSDRNKYPAANVFHLSGTFLNLGLAMALILTIMAFNWTQYGEENYVPEMIFALDEDIEIEPPRTLEPPKPLPPPPSPVIEEMPDEEILDIEEPDFLDQSIDETTSIVPPAIVKKKTAPKLEELPPPPPPEDTWGPEPFRVVEEMPRFPGCENLAGKEEKKQCATQQLLKFVYQHIQYPAVAREVGVEGTVVIMFVVEADGTVTNAEIVRDIGAQCGEEALRVVNLMNEQGIVWIPGKQRGREVRVQFNLPVKFRLE